MSLSQQHSIYLHIPFCRHRCAYCDFNTYAGQERLIPVYVQSLCAELRCVSEAAPRSLSIGTVYFGGGTPSLLSPEHVGEVLGAIRNSFALEDHPEITLEANPGTTPEAMLRELRGTEINRISFGVQSANGEELKMLERRHDFLDVLEAVSAARRAGFENVNLDLIYGLPEQPLETWQTTLRRVLDLMPEHISAYALSLERATPFGRWSGRGVLPSPDPDLAADMYEWASQELKSAGYVQYEISNWARPGYECRHNLQYWRTLPYLGFGAGAHGYAGGHRYSNVLGIKPYIERLGQTSQIRGAGHVFPFSPAVLDSHHQTSADDRAEFMITGLRLTREGISTTEFRARFGRDVRHQYPREIQTLVRLGLLEWAASETIRPPVPSDGLADEPAQVLRLTSRGRLLGNQVFIRFLE